MTIYLIIGGIALILGCILMYLILRPKLKLTQRYDQKIEIENRQLYNFNKQLVDEKETLTKELSSLKIQREEVSNSLDLLQNQAKQSAEVFFKQSMELARTNIAHDLELEESKYEQAKQDYKSSYKNLMAGCSEDLVNLIQEKQKELDVLDDKIFKLTREVDAAVEAAKRAEEIKNQANFYKLQLSSVDIEEIKLLRSIEPHLRDKETLNKVIWKSYYEKPTTDLIGRVIGSGTHTGIYKITNLDNQMCYVGQAVDLAARWKQHIKRGIGAETPTRNKLYPAMLTLGVENFSFEVIEECSREELDTREDYWQDYFKAKEFGYSIK